MLDIKLFREKPEIIIKNLEKRKETEKVKLVKDVIKLDEKWIKLKKQIDSLRHERNVVSQKINQLKKQGKSAKAEIKKAKDIPQEISKKEEKGNNLKQEMIDKIKQIPNIMHPKVPYGKDDSQNKTIRKEGKPKKFDFKIKNHVEICETLGIADFEKSAETSGKGFYYLKGDLALLNQALLKFAIDFMTKKGYTYIEPPLLVHKNIIDAAIGGIAEEFKGSIYSIKDEDLNLIGTSEHAILGMHENEVIKEENLPKKYTAYSMCFRKEIGSHGINEKGLWRTHQFNKVEQFIFCKPEDSWKYFDELLKNSEAIMKKLKLPYRVVEMCTGDLAIWKARAFDIEVYRPTTKDYGEVMSLSNCTDYQARDLNIRLERSDGNREVLHTLNNTAMATSRIMVAIIENYQQKGGTIKIPTVLVPYMNGKKFIGK